jgi:hypothetical protein
MLLAVPAGMLGGFIGGLLSRWIGRRRSVTRHRLPAMPAEVADQLDQAARRWANAQGQPLAAPLLARKLRLLYGLNQGRRSRRWSRW